ncbi:MAG: hypothetical protein ACRD1Z_12815 [Vicinamibacteria bacterium]
MTVDDYVSLVGTPRYPLCHPGLARVWRAGEGRFIDDAPLAHLLRAVHRGVPFQNGMCYSTVERVFVNAKANGWKNVVPYAGWLVIESPTAPDGQTAILHHAWAVCFTGREAEKGVIGPLVTEGLVLDFTVAMKSFETMRAFWNGRRKEIQEAAEREGTEEAKVRCAVQWRKEWVEAMRPLDEGDPVTCRVFGTVPEGHTYVGCPADMLEARKIFRDWHEKYREGEGPGEKSLTQEIEERLREGRPIDDLPGRIDVT